MISLKTAFEALILLCIFGMSAVSAIEGDASTYSAYDAAEFSAEYPINWNVDRIWSSEGQGYVFTGDEQSISLYFSENDIKIVMPKETLVSGYLDNSTLHLLGTLELKSPLLEANGEVESVVGTRENPVPIGTRVDLGNGWNLRVVEVIRDATRMVLKENRFNDPPESGSQFVLVKVEACYTGDDSSELSRYRLRVVGASAVAYDQGCGVMPDPLPDSEVFSGGCVEGYAGWEVKSSDVGSLVMYYDRYGVERIYFSLTGD